MFKEDLFREYPQARKPCISMADLGNFVNEKSKQEIHTLDEFATCHWEFRRLATQLAKEKRVNANSLTGLTRRAFILNYGAIFCLPLGQKDTLYQNKHSWLNMSGKELNIFWKALITNT